MNLTTFFTRFPEMSFAPSAYVQAYLDAALLRLDAAMWGTLIDEGQAYLACHLMAITPAGFTAGLSNKWGKSAYGDQYDRLCRLVGGGPAVI